MEQIFAKVIPIIALILIGYIIKRTQYLDALFFKNIKKLVYDLALPSILLISFLNIKLKAEYIILNLCIILLLLILNGFGRLVNRIKPISNSILPYLLSGAPIALVGIPLFSTAFGAENVTDLAIFVIGNEIFVWFIFMPLLRLEFAGEKFSFRGLINILKSPFIISISTGIFFNILGLSEIFLTNSILAGIYQTLGYLAQLGTPLILLIVGYDLEFNREYAKITVIYTIIRRVSFMGFGLLMAHFILPRFMEVTIYNQYALTTLFTLPPLFGLSTFFEICGGNKEQIIIGNNVVVLDTILCIISFIALVFVTNI